jgi:hypothetical protein
MIVLLSASSLAELERILTNGKRPKQGISYTYPASIHTAKRPDVKGRGGKGCSDIKDKILLSMKRI